MGIPHPIPYQGSKRHLAKIIVDYFPDDAERLIEPFAGSAAISLASAYYRKANRFVLNDINAPLIVLWEHIINQPISLGERYEFLWTAQQKNKRRYYDLVRMRFNKTFRPYYFLYLLARCVKASVRYNANGEFNQSPDNRRNGRHPLKMRKDIEAASMLLREKVSFRSIDYRRVLELTTPHDIVYLDPPYQGVYDKRDPRYIKGIAFDAFVHSLDALNERGISYIVSYDGRTGSKSHGKLLPKSLDLQHIEVHAGRSSQATLLGRSADTFESLYLSPALVERNADNYPAPAATQQLPLTW